MNNSRATLARFNATRPRPYGTHDLRVTSTRKDGFTLIEMLVVVVIIAISFSVFMTINFSFNNPADELKKEGLRLQQLLQFSLEQGVVRAEEYGLRINDNKYRFMILDEVSNKWQDVKDDKLMRSRELPDNVNFELLIEDVDVALDREDGDTEDADVEIKPQIFLMSSGELTPDFKLQLRKTGFDVVYELHGKPTGQFELRNLNDE